jgi:hypothetical protein
MSEAGVELSLKVSGMCPFSKTRVVSAHSSNLDEQVESAYDGWVWSFAPFLMHLQSAPYASVACKRYGQSGPVICGLGAKQFNPALTFGLQVWKRYPCTPPFSYVGYRLDQCSSLQEKLADTCIAQHEFILPFSPEFDEVCEEARASANLQPVLKSSG